MFADVDQARQTINGKQTEVIRTALIDFSRCDLNLEFSMNKLKLDPKLYAALRHCAVKVNLRFICIDSVNLVACEGRGTAQGDVINIQRRQGNRSPCSIGLRIRQGDCDALILMHG